MIWQIVKKQGLLFWRNPNQLVLFLGLPILLIAILGAALGSNFQSESNPLKLKIAFIEQEEERLQIDRFLDNLEGNLPPEAVEEIEANIGDMAPVHLLKSVFETEEMQAFIEIDYIDPSEQEEIMKDRSYTAMVTIPENFSFEVLQSMVLGISNPATIEVTHNEEQQLGGSVITNFLTQFQNELTKGSFLARKGIDLSALNLEEIAGEVISINEKNPISASAYYTIGMTVMNVLYLAGAIGFFAFEEKETNVFNRIILANVSRWTYFTGVLASGTIFAIIQTSIIFTFARIFYGVSWPNYIDFFIVTVAFSFAIGGLAVLLSAINYRLNSEIITNFFMNVITIIFSVLGGSFYPIGDFSPLLQQIGNMTPNGASLSAYITLLRGDGIAAASDHLIYLVIFGIIAVVLGAFCFPKRGVSS